MLIETTSKGKNVLGTIDRNNVVTSLETERGILGPNIKTGVNLALEVQVRKDRKRKASPGIEKGLSRKSRQLGRKRRGDRRTAP